MYAVQAKFGYSEPLTTAKAYTSLALITMMSQPASMLLQTISACLSVSGNVRRLEDYLKRADFEDFRHIERCSSRDGETSEDVVVLDNIVLNIAADSEKLAPITVHIKKGSATMISGQVGSGKSMLLKTILGEVAPKSGSVSIIAKIPIAYCSTTPWLRNASIKDNVVGDEDWDEYWYHTAIYVCDLGPDLASLPHGNDTLVGSRGVALSGGQKHRVALARALYSRCPLLLLDESFGALDERTKEKVADRVLKHSRKHGLTLMFVSHGG